MGSLSYNRSRDVNRSVLSSLFTSNVSIIYIYISVAQTSAGRDADWGRDVTRGKQLQTVPLNNWLLIWAPATSQNVLDNFLQQLRRLCGPMNIGLSPPVRLVMSDNW